MKTPRLLTAFVLVALWAAAPALGGGRVRAQDTGLTMNVRAGFDGYYKEAMWIPIRITLANDGPDLSGEIRIDAPRYDGSAVQYSRPVKLPSGSRKEIFMYISVEGYVSKVSVLFVSGRDQLATQSARVTQLSGSDLLYGVLAANASTFNVLTQVDPVNGQGRVAQLTVADLPPAGVVWRSLDALIVSDVDTGELTPEQHEALRAWVSGGGRLIVTGGPNWQKAVAGLGNLLPLAPSGAGTVTGLEPLAGYAYDDLPGPSALVTTGALQPGAVAVVSTSEGVPLIAERLLGYGRVDFLAFDPNLDPINNWRGLEGVFRGLLSASNERPGWAGAHRNWYNAGEAINAIPGIGLPHVLQVCAFLSGYIVVVGPLNYMILNRLKRRELAWITIPGIVLVFTLVTYLASFGLRGTRPTLHRLTVVQVWENSDRAQVDSLVGIFSPRRSEYNLQADGDLLLRPLPSSTYYSSVDTSLDGALIEQSDKSIIRQVRVDVGAIKPFVAQGQIPAPQFTSDLEYTFAGGQPTLRGTVSNLSTLTLRDAVVLAFSGYQRVGDVTPGAQVNVNISLASNRATWTAQAQNQILPPGIAGSGLPSSGYYYSGYDNTIENILGTVSYYDNRETYRRYSILTWLFDPYSSGGRGSGTYLVGWADQSPVNVSLQGEGFNTADQTLFIIRLQPQLVLSAGTVTVPPSLMTWEILDPGTGGGGSPYDSYLSQGYFSVRFRPFTGLDFRRITGLTLHLDSYGATGLLPLKVSLWDHTEGEWVELDGARWGSTPIESPERFVGGDGRIDVRVENTSFQNSVSIESLDFTLVMER